MALLDAYATAAQYRAIAGDKGAGTDATLDAELLGVSRLLERSLQLAPGAFNASAANQARVFDGQGGPVLYLRDRAGLAYFLQTLATDGLKIDSDLDGSYDDYAFDFADAWLRGLPENAAAHSEPFTAIELLPLASAPIWKFPDLPACVQITGTWGWAAVPELIKQLVIHRTKELRAGQLAAPGGDLPGIDAGVPMGARTFWLFKEAERLYGRRLPVIV